MRSTKQRGERGSRTGKTGSGLASARFRGHEQADPYGTKNEIPNFPMKIHIRWGTEPRRVVIEGNQESQHYCIKHARKTLRCKCIQTKPLSVWPWRSIFRAFHLRNSVRRDGPLDRWVQCLSTLYPGESPKRRAIYPSLRQSE
jgi:hypothetical protein